MMAYDRKWQIARGLLKEFVKQRVTLQSLARMNEGLAVEAKKVGATVEELKEVLHPIIREIVDEALGKK